MGISGVELRLIMKREKREKLAALEATEKETIPLKLKQLEETVAAVAGRAKALEDKTSKL